LLMISSRSTRRTLADVRNSTSRGPKLLCQEV
jgi:hypothetical protein